MQINQVEFISSFNDVKACPNYDIPEYAFIGRSNVGKSSLINYLTGRKQIARVSNTPGKTQLINYFLVDELWHLVDLPGYGYAQVSKKERAKFDKMIRDFLDKRNQLICTFILLDSRIPLQKIDLEFINWMGENGIPFVLVYTKIDGVRPRLREENVSKIQNALLEHWSELPQQFISSSVQKMGGEEILNFIEQTNESLK